MNKNALILQNVYQLDAVKDTLFKMDQHITFFFDMDENPIMVYILSGNTSALGFDTSDCLPLAVILKHIEKDNALAEIEGKLTFIEDSLKKLKTMQKETHLYLPFRHGETTLWCSIGFERLDNPVSKRLVFGRVNRVTTPIPKAIEYYQKAFQDPLTKLFTRETLRLHLSQITTFEGKYGLYVDLDDFKIVNDAHGHRTGDRLLQCLAEMFIQQWEHNVIYYRLGGDEFFVYVSGHTEETVLWRAQALIETIENVSCDGIKHPISASIGIVPITANNVDFTTLLDQGDQAMYTSKAKGRGGITFHPPHKP